MIDDTIYHLFTILDNHKDCSSLASTCKKYNIYLSKVLGIHRFNDRTLTKKQYLDVNILYRTMLTKNESEIISTLIDKMIIILYYSVIMSEENILIIVEKKLLQHWLTYMRELKLVNTIPQQSQILVAHNIYSRHKKILTNTHIFSSHRILITTPGYANKMIGNVDLAIIDYSGKCQSGLTINKNIYCR